MRSDTTPHGRRDLLASWHDTRARIAGLFIGRPDECGDTAVSTRMNATIRDVLLELVESASGAAHPDPQRDRTSAPGQVLAALECTTPHEAAMPWLITQAVMIEHDLRTTLDSPGARDDVAVKIALDELAGRFSDRVSSAGLPSLRVTVEQWGTIIGDGPASACVVADRFEFVRAMSGRRSESEVRRWNWSGDPEPYLALISAVGLSKTEVRERDPRVPDHMREREFVL